MSPLVRIINFQYRIQSRKNIVIRIQCASIRVVQEFLPCPHEWGES